MGKNWNFLIAFSAVLEARLPTRQLPTLKINEQGRKTTGPSFENCWKQNKLRSGPAEQLSKEIRL